MSTSMNGYTFIGFMQLHKNEYWGIQMGEHVFVACHLRECPSKEHQSEESKKEQKLIDSGKHYVLYLKGNDNTSYLKRFSSRDAAIKWYYKTNEFVPDDKSCWVNS